MVPSPQIILFALLPFVSSYAVPDSAPVAVAPRHPLITPSPTLQDVASRTVRRRGVLDDLKGDVDSVLSGLGSNIPSYVASGVPNFFQDFPTGDKVQSSLGIDDDQLKALPTSVLNVP